MTTTLTKIGSNPSETIEVLTNSAKFPCVTDENAGKLLKCFRGIGQLREDGYDVTPIKGHPVVFQLK